MLRTGTIRLQTWFPPGDALAEIVARLCILREDLALEMEGFRSDNLRELDSNSEEWRRAYFFRSLVRTIREVIHALQALSANSEFQRILLNSPAKYRLEFKRVVKEMNASHGTVKHIRDALGGHVLDRMVRAALQSMQYERFGLFQAAPITGNTRYKFAGEIVAEMLVAGVPYEERIQKLQADLERVSSLLSFYSLIDWILYAYADARGLHFM